MEAVIRFGVSVAFCTGAVYTMNKYGLNIVDQPFDFIVVIVCFVIGNTVLGLK